MKFSAAVTLQYDTIFSPFSVQEWRKGLDWMQASGLDGAELCISHYNDLDVPAIRYELDKRNLGCSTLSTGQARGLEGLCLSGVSDDVVKRTQKRFYEHIDAAAVLGSKVTLGLMRGLGSTHNAGADRAQLREAMLPIADYAQKKGVTVLLEPINRYETILLNSGIEVYDFIRNDLGNPDSIGILWDLFHANIEDRDYAETVAMIGGKIKHVHIADSNRAFPGFGHTDMDAVFRLLYNAGFEEYASFECLNKPSRDIVLEETASWVRHIRGL
ncbi:MAG: sugar phosphate isomerase/epimerase [Lachnospiraceae bacterium]|nr:sugar phosphate isomerase/epimerase [Lachnospiraceae bacterium]